MLAGFGLPAAIVVFLSVMTTNVMCVYSASLSYLNISPKTPFWKPALSIGVLRRWVLVPRAQLA